MARSVFEWSVEAGVSSSPPSWRDTAIAVLASSAEGYGPSYAVAFAGPGGSEIALDDTPPDNPILSVKPQELFGLTETPRGAGE